jgi:membrane protein DedA with SNARE-associated domain
MPHQLLDFISAYGYGAVFLGAIFEGESIMLLSGLLSHEDYFTFPWIVFWAFLGAVLGDFFWFILGRYRGETIINKWAWFKKIMGRPVSLVGKKPAALSFLMRFMYGFRLIVPFSIGMSKLPIKSFLFWNSLGAVAWVTVFGGLGYLLADVLEAVFGNLRKYEIVLAIVIILLISLAHTIGGMVKRSLKKVVADLE